MKTFSNCTGPLDSQRSSSYSRWLRTDTNSQQMKKPRAKGKWLAVSKRTKQWGAAIEKQLFFVAMQARTLSTAGVNEQRHRVMAHRRRRESVKLFVKSRQKHLLSSYYTSGTQEVSGVWRSKPKSLVPFGSRNQCVSLKAQGPPARPLPPTAVPSSQPSTNWDVLHEWVNLGSTSGKDEVIW